MLFLFFSFKPVRVEVLMKLQLFALTVQLLNLFLGIMLLTMSFQELTGDGQGGTVTTSTIIWMNVAVLIMPMLQIGVAIITMWIRVRILQKTLKSAKESTHPAHSKDGEGFSPSFSNRDDLFLDEISARGLKDIDEATNDLPKLPISTFATLSISSPTQAKFVDISSETLSGPKDLFKKELTTSRCEEIDEVRPTSAYATLVVVSPGQEGSSGVVLPPGLETYSRVELFRARP